jgi:hypothetical protein
MSLSVDERPVCVAAGAERLTTSPGGLLYYVLVTVNPLG